jgi:hypothetical protein
MASKRMRLAIAALVVAVFAAVAATVSPARALADNSCTTASNGNVTCVDQTLTQVGQAVDEESSSATAVGNAKAGVTYLVSMHLKLNEHQALKEGQCRWFNKAYVAGFKNGTGKLRWKLDRHVHACMSHGRLIKIGGGVTGLDCHNLVKLKRPKGVVKGKVEFVDHMTWQATASVKSTATATVGVSVSVHNADFSCQASANSTATSEGVATASATATASSKVKATSSAQGKLVQILNDVHQHASTSAVASAKASATAKASAKATCSPSTPPPPPPPPPPVPPFVSITSFINLNQVPAGKTSGPAPFTVNASDSGSVTVNPDLGGISDCNSSTPQSSITFQLAAGNNNECVIYYAPNDADQPTSDTITYTATVTTAGGTAHDQKVDTVAITYPVRP